jgi:hypothetical protein
MTPPTFSNPYKGLNEKELTRLQTYIAKADHDFVFIGLHPGSGSVSIVTNTLFARFVEALKKHKIVDAMTQRLEFENFVVNMEITQRKKK